MQNHHLPKIDLAARTRFLQSEEGNIFTMGCCMLILWVAAMAMFWRLGHPMRLNMLTVGLTHIVAGRAASLAHGTQVGLSPWLTSFLAVYADTMAMFIVYPVLVFSYENFVERRFFQKHMKPVFDSARKRLPRMRGSRIAGVFLFVFFPFWMTGIIVGAVLGYLLGLRTWVTMVTAIAGSAVAVITWVYAYDKMFGWLGDVHQSVPVTISILIIGGLVGYRLVRRHREQTGRNHT